MKKKIVTVVIVVIFLVLSIPLVIGGTEKMTGDPGPELDTYILSGFSFPCVNVHVRNIGDAIAHNVKITDITIEGIVILNFQKSKIWSVDLEPKEMTILDPNSMNIGFGKFTISMTVTCDEGTSSTSSATGLIFGPLVFIP